MNIGNVEVLGTRGVVYQKRKVTNEQAVNKTTANTGEGTNPQVSVVGSGGAGLSEPPSVSAQEEIRLSLLINEQESVSGAGPSEPSSHSNSRYLLFPNRRKLRQLIKSPYFSTEGNSLEVGLQNVEVLISSEELKEKIINQEKRVSDELPKKLPMLREITKRLLKRCYPLTERELIAKMKEGQDITHKYLKNVLSKNLGGLIIYGNYVGADLSNSRFMFLKSYEVNLTRASFENSRLNQVSLKGATLDFAEFNNAEIVACDLSGARFISSKLRSVRINASLLKGAVFNGSDFTEARIINSKLTDSQLINVQIRGADFKGTNLNNVIFDLDLSLLDTEEGIYNEFDHNRHGNCKILTAIESIDDKYKELKINLITQVLEHISESRLDISPYKDKLFSFLTSREIYVSDSKIKQYIKDEIFPYLKERANDIKIMFEKSHVILLADFICEEINVDQDYYKKNGAIINQLMLNIKRLKGEEGEEEKLMTAEKNMISALVRLIPKELQHSICHLTEDESITQFFESCDYFLFLNPDDSCVIFDIEAIKKILANIALGDDFQKLYLFKKNEDDSSDLVHSELTIADVKKNLEDIYSKIPLLNRFFKAYIARGVFHKFIETLHLGSKYTHLFLNATKKSGLDITKLTGGENIQIRNEISDRLKLKLRDGDQDKIQLTGSDAKNITISHDHLVEVLTVFDCMEQSTEEKAVLLLCLATIFSKYSSASVFGVDKDSPQMLRNYALALINKSVEISIDIIPKRTQESWQNKLAEEDRVFGNFTCTDALCYEMKKELTISSFMHNKLATKWFSKLYPVSW